MDKTRLPTLDVQKPRRLRGTPAERFVWKYVALGIVYTVIVGGGICYATSDYKFRYERIGKENMDAFFKKWFPVTRMDLGVSEESVTEKTEPKEK